MNISDEAIEAAVDALVASTLGDRHGINGEEFVEAARAALEAAAPHLMSDRKHVRTHYRSVTPDGEVWCESKDPQEVRKMSEGHDCVFEAIKFYETTDGWQEWME